MKKVLSIISLIFLLGFTANSQVTPYVVFSENNYCLEAIVRTIPANQTMKALIDFSDPSNIKTYMFLQKNAGITVAPTLPASGGGLVENEYIHDVELTFNTNGAVSYVIDDQNSVWIKIN